MKMFRAKSFYAKQFLMLRQYSTICNVMMSRFLHTTPCVDHSPLHVTAAAAERREAASSRKTSYHKKKLDITKLHISFKTFLGSTLGNNFGMKGQDTSYLGSTLSRLIVKKWTIRRPTCIRSSIEKIILTNAF